jgi:hypothetical protein
LLHYCHTDGDDDCDGDGVSDCDGHSYCGDVRVKGMLQPSRSLVLLHCGDGDDDCDGDGDDDEDGRGNGGDDGAGDSNCDDPRSKGMLQPSRSLVLLLHCCYTGVTLFLTTSYNLNTITRKN